MREVLTQTVQRELPDGSGELTYKAEVSGPSHSEDLGAAFFTVRVLLVTPGQRPIPTKFREVVSVAPADEVVDRLKTAMTKAMAHARARLTETFAALEAVHEESGWNEVDGQ